MEEVNGDCRILHNMRKNNTDISKAYTHIKKTRVYYISIIITFIY